MAPKKHVINLITGIDETVELDEIAQKNLSEAAQSWEAEADNRAFAELREKRNRLLHDTDWWASSDLSISEAQKKYRQALRDLPVTVDINDWPDITWPTKPS
jgi:hypothetical protein